MYGVVEVIGKLDVIGLALDTLGTSAHSALATQTHYSHTHISTSVQCEGGRDCV